MDATPPPSTPTGDEALSGFDYKMDELGVVVVNCDGTLSRINNWNEMSAKEKASAARLIAKRNEKRRRELKEAGAELNAKAAEETEETETLSITYMKSD